MQFEPGHINDWIVLVGSATALLGGVWMLVRRCVRYVRDMDGIHEQRGKFKQHFGDQYADAIHGILDDLITSNDIAHAKHSILLRRLEIGIYVCDAQTGNCLYCDGLEEIFGLSPLQMLGLGWTAQVDGKEKRLENWEWCVKHQVNYHDEYTVINASNGRRTLCRTEAFLTRGNSPRYVGYVEIIQPENETTTPKTKP